MLAAAGRYDLDLCRPNGGPDVPGRPVTDQQVRAYMQDRHHHSQRVAAARAGFSERTGRLRAVEEVPDEILAHLSPLGWEHVNLTLCLVASRPGDGKP